MTAPTTSVTALDVAPLAADAVRRGYLLASCYLIDVEAGFELWQGGTGLATTAFSVMVRSELGSAGMAHYSTLLKVVIDVPDADHDRELAFWRGATGLELPALRLGEYHGSAVRGHDFWLLTQRLDAGMPRVHLDMHTDDLDAEVARLERLGATRVRQVHRWWVLRDPAGLLFCVLPEEPGSLTDANAQRWG
jgi:hypothetical protein